MAGVNQHLHYYLHLLGGNVKCSKGTQRNVVFFLPMKSVWLLILKGTSHFNFKFKFYFIELLVLEFYEVYLPFL